MKRTLEFYSEGFKLRGDLYTPEGLRAGEKRTAILLCHGYTGVKNLYLPNYARRPKAGPGAKPNHRHHYYRQKPGRARRTEILFHNIAGRFYITGTPRRRDWFANLVAHPEFTFHLKESVQVDLTARATPISENSRRSEIMGKIIDKLGGGRGLNAYVEDSPLMEVELSNP